MTWEAVFASFIASAGFGIIFNVPRTSLVGGGIAGMAGWLTYILFVDQLGIDKVFATLTASFLIATISQFLAKFYRMPGTVFSIAGIIPLVPGGVAYNTMREVVENNFIKAIELAVQVFMISGAIAFGLVLAGVLSQIIYSKSAMKS